MINVPRREALIDHGGRINRTWDANFFRPLGEGYGTWIAVAYLAANFSWTVQEADQITFAYTLMGQRMEVALTLRTTASGAVASGTVAIPAGKVAARDMSRPVQVNDNGTLMAGVAKVAADGTVITIYRMDEAAFTDLRAVEGAIDFEVQG